MPARDGIYYASPPSRLASFDFLTGTSKTILTTQKRLALGVTLSPDERWLLYSQVDQGGKRPHAGGELPVVVEPAAPRGVDLPRPALEPCPKNAALLDVSTTPPTGRSLTLRCQAIAKGSLTRAQTGRHTLVAPRVTAHQPTDAHSHSLPRLALCLASPAPPLCTGRCLTLTVGHMDSTSFKIRHN